MINRNALSHPAPAALTGRHGGNKWTEVGPNKRDEPSHRSNLRALNHASHPLSPPTIIVPSFVSSVEFAKSLSSDYHIVIDGLPEVIPSLSFSPMLRGNYDRLMLENIFACYGIDGIILHSYRMGVFNKFKPRPMKIRILVSAVDLSIHSNRHSDPTKFKEGNRDVQQEKLISKDAIKNCTTRKTMDCDILKTKIDVATQVDEEAIEIVADKRNLAPCNSVIFVSEKKRGRPKGSGKNEKGKYGLEVANGVKNGQESFVKRKLVSRNGAGGAIIAKLPTTNTPNTSPAAKFTRIESQDSRLPLEIDPLTPG